jgi:hypothetical protein
VPTTREAVNIRASSLISEVTPSHGYYSPLDKLVLTTDNPSSWLLLLTDTHGSHTTGCTGIRLNGPA